MQNLVLNKDKIYCNPNDYETVNHQEYFNLKIIPKIGELEREIGLLNDLAEIIQNPNLLYIGDKYASFYALNCQENFEKIFIINKDEDEDIFIQKNIKHASNIFLNKSIDDLDNSIIKIYDDNFDILDILLTKKNPIILCKENETLNTLYSYKYKLSNSNQVLYIPEQHYQNFFDNFYYYILDDTIEYDNLINLCIMVKNGGDLFEKVLTQNLPVIDRWTILDTGSTDNTIEIINKVLVGKKKGNLYQEPFINFRESRNRCLDLAGKSCKFNLMLDDTYIIKGNLRNFLNLVRGDQFSDSFSLLIRSDDVEYYSNRVTKSKNKLRYIYTMHEVIQKDDNVNVVIPIDQSYIYDERADYMNDRTMSRKDYDLKCLFEMLEEDPDNSRHIYYVAQTYNLIEKHELAAEYFHKRAFHPNEGFFQEKYDALFEMTRIYNFKLNKPWDECEKYYKLLIEWEPERPEPFYFMAVHYHLEGNNDKAYELFKKSYEIGYPISKQYSLKPTLSYYFTPKFLVPYCYTFQNFKLGEECCKLFLTKNKVNEVVKDDSFEFDNVKDWYNIFRFLNMMPPLKSTPVIPTKDIFAFVADGGYTNWSGSSINKVGVGGSETFIIEIARNLAKLTNYKIIVFCNCGESEEYEGVKYLPINEYFYYCANVQMKHVMISRYSEYIPVAIQGYVENLYVILHDLKLTGNIVPVHSKIKNVFCLSEWHKSYFLSFFPQFTDRTTAFGYGIDFQNFLYDNSIQKIKHSFIYSSFPNRGLIVLLKMWNRIKERFNDAILNIFVNLDNDWVNQNFRDEIIEIRKLLEDLKDKNVVNHGWVSKKTLGEYWKKSEIWFYPCKFAETFCLTALEAALSKTLCITNNLAALQDTVGDRGIKVEGSISDVLTEEWQNKAFESICFWIDNEQKEEYINKNYNWSITQSWYNRAEALCDILNLDKKKKEIDTPLEIKDVGLFYGYQHDYITEYINQHGDWESEYNNIFDKHLNENSVCIDVGAFIGTNTIKMAKKCKKVYSFEPFEQTFNLLRKNLEVNNINNVQYFQKAIGNENKKIFEMYYPEQLEQYGNISNVGAMRLTYEFHENTKIKVDVDMIKLDDYFFSHKIDLIKLDCEGCELDVLKGAKYVLQKFKPILLIENFEKKEILDNVWKELEGLDYKYLSLSNVNGMFYSEDNLDYEGMYNWSHDLPIDSYSKGRFLNVLSLLKAIQNCKVLEIGVNLGTSLIHILKNINETAVGTAIDIWNVSDIENRCLENFKKAGMLERIRIMKGDSTERLIELIKKEETFDFIYVDGSHTLCDTYSDCLLSWKLLKKGGIMAIDDYLLSEDEIGRKDMLYLPLEAVNEFINKYENKIKILDKGYRLFLQKLEE
jgi:FkbM family methyltransferase